MTRYPTPPTRPASPRPVILIANQFALFGQPGIVPPTRTTPQPPTQPKTETVTSEDADKSPVHLLHSFCPDTACIPVGNAAKLRANLAAIETLKAIQQQNRSATSDEQKRSAQYTGWGGLSAIWKTDEYDTWQQSQTDTTVFIEESVKRWGSQYGRTRQRLADLLTPAEQTAAEASTLNAFYTAPDVVAAMWQAVEQFGFTGGRILEPAAGIGYFIGLMPPALREQSAWVAVEKDSLSGQVLQQHPK